MERLRREAEEQLIAAAEAQRAALEKQLADVTDSYGEQERHSPPYANPNPDPHPDPDPHPHPDPLTLTLTRTLTLTSRDAMPSSGSSCSIVGT